MRVARFDTNEAFTREETAAVTARSDVRGLWCVAHAWLVIGASMALYALWPNPLTFVVAVILIGGRQLGLAILMHDAAHGVLDAHEGNGTIPSANGCAPTPSSTTRSAIAIIISSIIAARSSRTIRISVCRRRSRSRARVSGAR